MRVTVGDERGRQRQGLERENLALRKSLATQVERVSAAQRETARWKDSAARAWAVALTPPPKDAA
jgi:hypothetical protein